MESEINQTTTNHTDDLTSLKSTNVALNPPPVGGILYDCQNTISLQMFFKQISGHKYMFLDHDKNVCKMSNQKEIMFFSEKCPASLQVFVPRYMGSFFLR